MMELTPQAIYWIDLLDTLKFSCLILTFVSGTAAMLGITGVLSLDDCPNRPVFRRMFTAGAVAFVLCLVGALFCPSTTTTCAMYALPKDGASSACAPALRSWLESRAGVPREPEKHPGDK